MFYEFDLEGDLAMLYLNRITQTEHKLNLKLEIIQKYFPKLFDNLQKQNSDQACYTIKEFRTDQTSLQGLYLFIIDKYIYIYRLFDIG